MKLWFEKSIPGRKIYMIVVIILEYEYGKVEGRINFFLEVAAFARREEVLIIINEGLYNKLEKLMARLPERFYDEFEMDHISYDDISELNVCALPDRIFDVINEEAETRSKALLNLYNNRYESIEKWLISTIDRYIAGRDKHIDYFLNTLEIMKSVSAVAEHYNCPIIPYVFSSIRKVHGYQQTLYVAHIDSKLYSSLKAQEMYESFMDFYGEMRQENLFLERKEIQALLGKTRNLKLIPYIGTLGEYEVGVVAGGRHILPMVYQYDYATDDDINYILGKMYAQSEIKVRLHPNQMNYCGIGRKHLQNDPIAFILGSKKMITVQSQFMLKAAMWAKPIAVLGKGMPYSFLFSSNIDNAVALQESDINFILFCYLVPSNCMWSREYWLWRMTNPSPKEIFFRHIQAIFRYAGVDEKACFMQNRFKFLLEHRNLTEDEVNEIIEGKQFVLHFPFLVGRAVLELGKNEIKTMYAINKDNEGNSLLTSYKFEHLDSLEKIYIYLLDDIDGYVSVLRVYINGIRVRVFEQEEIYINKGEPSIEISDNICKEILPTNTIEDIKVVWTGREYNN